MLLIVGNTYHFTDLDFKLLNKQYSTVKQIKESELPNFLKEANKKVTIVDNTNKCNLICDINKESIKYYTIADFLENRLYKLHLPTIRNLQLKPYSKLQYLLKRVIDLSISIPLLIIASPIMLYSAYKIKKESPDGSIIFRQQRVGKSEKEFTCYKFRSMRTDVNYSNRYTQVNDPRVFPWGDFMRKTRIDELPQIVNIIKGDLHLIGPRAEWIDLAKDYEEQLPNYHKRHTNAPGLTGWAQVNYP